MPELDIAINTRTQRLYWRELVAPPFAVASLVLCVLAHVVYYAFPRQRIFPRSMLSWLNLYNILFAAYEIWKWFPSSALHHSWASKIEPSSPACRISLFIDHLTTIGPTACSTLIAFTVFLVIIRPGHLETNRAKYYWGYLTFAAAYPAALGLIASFAFTHTPDDVGCEVSYPVNYFLAVPNFGFYGLQAILIVFALFKVRQVMDSVQSVGRKNFPFKYLIGKLIITYIYQTFYLMPIQVESVWLYLQDYAYFSKIAFISRNLGPPLDALTFMFMNPDFLAWLQLHFARLRNRLRHRLRPQLPSKESCENLNAAYRGTNSVSIQMNVEDPELEILDDYGEEDSQGVNSAVVV
eukprot:Phypoly_transcript_12466.p1 GENE.Phypoly_transcript_12466~~Phypoly_transcript_12466.p1  ORF type:complete len:352 (+),score=7.60 Phypoly_transcript_12466:65-1120(+)